MSTEPNRPIEKELEAYARWRQAQAGDPPPMPESMRRRLHAEVHRSYRLDDEEAPRIAPWWRMLWPRLALAGATCALGALLWVQYFGPSETTVGNLAQTDVRDEESSPSELETPFPEPQSRAASDATLYRTNRYPPETRTQPERRPDLRLDSNAAPLLLQDSSAAVSTESDVAPTAPAPTRPQPDAGPARPKAVSTEPNRMSQRYGLAPTREQPSPTSRAPRPMAIPPTDPAPIESDPLSPRLSNQPTAAIARPHRAMPVTDSTLTADTESPDASSGGVRFRRLEPYRVNPNSPPFPKVLTSFEVIHSGEQVTLIDADGSIYRGTFTDQTVTSSSVPDQQRYRQALRAARSSMQETQTESAAASLTAALPNDVLQPTRAFSVSGTNRTLGTRVTFTGTFSPLGANPTSAASSSGTDGTDRSYNEGSASALRLESYPTLVHGQARLADGTRLEIIAVPDSE